MIYCNLKGGLGNMMFQIATSISLSIDKDDQCSFPNLMDQINYLNSENTYNPNLNHANEYLTIFKNLKTVKITDNPFYVEYPFHFDDKILPDGSVLIDGFFQSEKYFLKNKSEIIKTFNFDEVCGEYIKNTYDFLNKNTTSIHVRRGDYLKYPNHHPPQTLDYYHRSIDILKEKTEVFVIFSDDILWCKENIKLDNVIYIDREKDYIELYLMSLCENNIIANSSFSWWGAWLNNNPNKVVIGPNIWFGDAIRHNTNDILPESWIKI